MENKVNTRNSAIIISTVSCFVVIRQMQGIRHRRFFANALKANRNHMYLRSISFYDLQEFHLMTYKFHFMTDKFHFMTDKFHFMTDKFHFMTEPTQNDIVVGILLMMFAILPSQASLPPRPWRNFAFRD